MFIASYPNNNTQFNVTDIGRKLYRPLEVKYVCATKHENKSLFATVESLYGLLCMHFEILKPQPQCTRETVAVDVTGRITHT